MAQRHRHGWLKKEKRAQGETWVLFFRTTRQSDGKRVENKVPIGLVRHLPEASSAWAEVERLHMYPVQFLIASSPTGRHRYLVSGIQWGSGRENSLR